MTSPTDALPLTGLTVVEVSSFVATPPSYR